MADKKPPLSEKELKDLQSAWLGARRELQDFRRTRTEVIRQFAGYRYGQAKTPQKVPVNLLDMFCSVYTQTLVPDNPRVRVWSEAPELKTDAFNLEFSTNRWIEVSDFADSTLRPAIVDALFGMGIIRTSTIENDDGELNWRAPWAGSIDATKISFNDYGYDVAAPSWNAISFEGHKYCLDYEELMSSDRFGERTKEYLKPDEPTENDENGGLKTNMLGRASGALSRRAFRQVVNVIDIYCPKYKLLLTVPDGQGDWSDPYDWMEWEGPYTGMYHKIMFNKVPDNLMPKSFAAEVYDLHDAYNRLLNKCVRDAEREKLIPTVSSGGQEDIERLKMAANGEAVKVSNGASVQEMHFGGVSQTSMAFILGLQELFNRRCYNLDLLAGLNPQAPTLGQTELLTRASASETKRMQRVSQKFITQVATDIASFIYNDPDAEIPLVYEYKSGKNKFKATHTWTPEERRGDFLAFNFGIDPYNQNQPSPTEELQTIMQYVTQVAVPLLPMFQAQGAQINLRALTNLIAERSNTHGLGEIIQFSAPNPPDNPRMQISHGTVKSPVTQRTQVRKSEAQPGNATQQLQQAMLSVGSGQPRNMIGAA